MDYNHNEQYRHGHHEHHYGPPGHHYDMPPHGPLHHEEGPPMGAPPMGGPPHLMGGPPPHLMGGPPPHLGGGGFGQGGGGGGRGRRGVPGFMGGKGKGGKGFGLHHPPPPHHPPFGFGYKGGMGKGCGKGGMRMGLEAHKLHLQLEMVHIKRRLIMIKIAEEGNSPSSTVKLRRLAVREAVLTQKGAKLHARHHVGKWCGGRRGRRGASDEHLVWDLPEAGADLVVVDTRFLTGDGKADPTAAQNRAQAIVSFLASKGYRHVLVAKPGSQLLNSSHNDNAKSIQAASGCVGKSILRLLEHELKNAAPRHPNTNPDAASKAAVEKETEHECEATDDAPALNIVVITGRPQLMKRAIAMGGSRGVKVMRGKALMRQVRQSLNKTIKAADGEANPAIEVGPDLVPVVLPTTTDYPVDAAAATAVEEEDTDSDSDSEEEDEDHKTGGDVANLMHALSMADGIDCQTDEDDDAIAAAAAEEHDLAIAMAMQDGEYDMLSDM